MSIHKEGYKILGFGFLFLVLVNVIVSIFWSEITLFVWAVIICSLALYVFLLFFFRWPERSLEPNHGLIYAPADGKVVVIEETDDSVPASSVAKMLFSP